MGEKNHNKQKTAQIAKVPINIYSRSSPPEHFHLKPITSKMKVKKYYF
jgi:hypothetical protein